jgi:hypothetical protein
MRSQISRDGGVHDGEELLPSGAVADVHIPDVVGDRWRDNSSGGSVGGQSISVAINLGATFRAHTDVPLHDVPPRSSTICGLGRCHDRLRGGIPSGEHWGCPWKP